MHVAPEALQRAGDQHRLRRAPDPHQDIDAGVLLHGRHDPGCDITLTNEFDPGTGLLHLLDKALVAWPVKHDHCQLIDIPALRVSDPSQVFLDRCVDVDGPPGLWPHGDLVHVGKVGEEQGVSFGDGHDGERARSAVGEERHAIDGIHRDIDSRGRALADSFTDIEHRSLALFALSDHHRAVYLH